MLLCKQNIICHVTFLYYLSFVNFIRGKAKSKLAVLAIHFFSCFDYVDYVKSNIIWTLLIEKCQLYEGIVWIMLFWEIRLKPYSMIAFSAQNEQFLLQSCKYCYLHCIKPLVVAKTMNSKSRSSRLYKSDDLCNTLLLSELITTKVVQVE